MEEEALFIRDGGGYVGTILSQGGWDPAAANGGTALALLAQCLDEVPTLTPMTLSRYTADLVRPVPLGRRLDVRSTVLREGKKIQLVQLLLLVDDVEHVRATALRLRDAELPGEIVPASTTEARPGDTLVPPDQSRDLGELAPSRPGFLRAVDMRRARTIDGSGMGAWIRLRVRIVAGEPVTPTARLAYCFDYANLIGLDDHPGGVTMINPDVSAHVLRPPSGEWTAITGDTRFNPAMARGISYATFSDAEGVFAVGSMGQIVQPR